MNIFIRNAEISDFESITELANQLGYEASDIAIQHRLKTIVAHPDHCVFVAVENTKVIGWIHGFYSMQVETDFFVEIGGLIVNQHHRKSGIGKILVNEVIKWTQLKKCKKVRVRCNVIRKESHRFYENIGFEINKEQKIFDKYLH